MIPDLSFLKDQQITGVQFLPPDTWTLQFSSGGPLQVGSLWRFVTSEAVVITSNDHGQQFGLPSPIDAGEQLLKVISDLPISAVAVRSNSADLVLEFGDKGSLEIIANSSGYESWALYSPSGAEFVAQGGGTIVEK